MILECVDGLLAKLKTTAEEEGKFDAKEYLFFKAYFLKVGY